jgi:uncharacterized membrane protein YphA (DoxX/SURF4 family)
MWKMVIRTNAPAASALIRLMVGAVFLSEGIQKFLFPDQLGAYAARYDDWDPVAARNFSLAA